MTYFVELNILVVFWWYGTCHVTRDVINHLFQNGPMGTKGTEDIFAVLVLP